MTQPTGGRRPVNPAVTATHRPVAPPTATRRPVASATTARPLVATGRPVTSVSHPTAATSRRPPVTTATTAIRRPGVPASTITRRPVPQSTTTTRRPLPQSTTTIRRPGTQTTTVTRRPGTHVATPTRRVTGWPHHGKKHGPAHPAGTTPRHTTVHRKHPGGGTAVTRHGRHIPHTPGSRITTRHTPGARIPQTPGTRPSHTPGRPIPGRRTVRYIPGRPGYSTVYYPGTPGSVDYIEQVHPGQPIPAGGPIGQPIPMGTQGPIAQPTPAGSYGSCPSAGPAPAAGPAPTMGPAPVMGPAPATSTGPTSTPATPRPCHNCGTSIRGCTTLSRFAFNSAELKSSHKSQLRALAERILRQSSNAVIATGHTDSSGTEDYNEALGERRAAAVVKELKKQLALLKPGSQKTLFWKTDSKGETKPVSGTDAAANRRVTICVRKGSFAR